MKPTLVTGATGFVGWHVARKLVERGHRVRALVRKGAVADLDVESVTGDLRDRASLDRAMAGCGTVFHVAGDYRLWAPDPEEIYQTNVDGTRNMLQAARDAGVDKMVYTSTVGCIGINGHGAGTEEAATRLEDMKGPYKRSKYLAELEVINFAHTGFPVTLVNPTAPIGDRDVKPTPTGKIILDYLHGRMPAYVDTGLNFVDVDDVAEGHLLALERGRSGDRYILGSENLTLKQMFDRLASISGKPAPRFQMPYAVALAAGIVSTAVSKITRTNPRVPLDGVRMARRKMWVSQDKAKQRLGYTPSAVDGALQRAVDWFRARGMA